MSSLFKSGYSQLMKDYKPQIALIFTKPDVYPNFLYTVSKPGSIHFFYFFLFIPTETIFKGQRN